MRAGPDPAVSGPLRARHGAETRASYHQCMFAVTIARLLGRSALAAACLAVPLAACAGGQTAAAGHRHHESSSEAARAASAAAASGSTSPPRCATSALTVWLGLGEGGAAAGSTYYPLELTNVSPQRCQLVGYPGVSAQAGDHQVGSPAARDSAVPVRPVTLAPGATAHAVLRIVDVGNFPPARCTPVTAGELRVYPPNDFASTSVPFSIRACSVKGTIFMSVQAVQPRIGVPGHPEL